MAHPPPQREPGDNDNNNDNEITEVPANFTNTTVEVSPTSSQGHPSWTESQVELAAAQNDVLVTVGLCLRENHPRQKKGETTGLLMKENEVGLLVGALDLTAGYLGGWSLISVRSRVQVRCFLPPTP